jgi:Zn-dependent oligopeptidase
MLAKKFIKINNLKEDKSNKDRLWHPSVVVYNVHDENDKHISNLIIDPYIRDKKIDSIWSYSGRESSLIANAKPLVYLNLNVKDSNSTLTFEQVKKLFYEVS